MWLAARRIHPTLWRPYGADDFALGTMKMASLCNKDVYPFFLKLMASHWCVVRTQKLIDYTILDSPKTLLDIGNNIVKVDAKDKIILTDEDNRKLTLNNLWCLLYREWNVTSILLWTPSLGGSSRHPSQQNKIIYRGILAFPLKDEGKD